MGLGGLIAGALGGAAKGYVETSQSELRKQQTLDLQKQTMAMEEEKQLRIDEIRRNRDIAQKKREIEEIDPLKAKSDANRTTVVGTAETGVLQGREDALRPGKVATTKAMGGAETEVLAGREDALRPGKVATGRALAEAQGDVERGNLAKYAADPDARKGVRAKAQDSETSSQRASAAATSNADRRAQSEFNRLENARAAAVDYQDAMDRGDEAAVKEARKRGLRFGVDPAGVKRGALKVTEDDMGNKVLVHEDDKGNVTRVDTSKLPAYGETKRGGASSTGGPKEGDRSKSKSGKDIIYRNDQWEYE